MKEFENTFAVSNDELSGTLRFLESVDLAKGMMRLVCIFLRLCRESITPVSLILEESVAFSPCSEKFMIGSFWVLHSRCSFPLKEPT